MILENFSWREESIVGVERERDEKKTDEARKAKKENAGDESPLQVGQSGQGAPFFLIVETTVYLEMAGTCVFPFLKTRKKDIPKEKCENA